MKRFIIFLISLYIATTISAQKYISFDREIFIPENKFSLNEWLMRDTKSSNDALKISSSISRISKLSGMEHSTYQLTYGSIPLDFSSVNIHKKDGIVVSVNGNLSITDNIDTIPKISPQEALSIAIEHMQAKSYSWQVKPPFWEDQEDTKYLLQEPIPQLVICPNFKNATKTPTLAYKIELFSMEPFMHQYVYINANNGEIIHIHPLLRNINGTAETRYSGTQIISTSYVNNLYRLIDETRGGGIYTYSLYDNSYNSYFLTDDDNAWTSSEYHASKQDAALDAHWGAMKTYDFFLEKYDRNSIDNEGLAINNYVNYPWINPNNAGWDFSTHSMYYGPGYINFDALTSLDVIAHELGHGITNSYQNMLYEGETGAINESISDIWGACVEYYAAPNKQHWRMGEDITLNAPALRYMDNPNLGGDPDTYGGTYYLDSALYSQDAVVHHNSGVPNYWFYLLSDGGIGINDNGYAYSVDGIGIYAAADIVYESLNYLQNVMTFTNYATITRNVAVSLYGMCADETINLVEAWRAVGVTIEEIPETLNITETLQTGYSRIYVANGIITALNIVQTGAIEILESTTKVVLAPGFHAELGASVIARIVPCENSNNRSEILPSIIEDTNVSCISARKYNDMSIFVSPNPAKDEIAIHGIEKECNYTIYDSMGKLMKLGVLNAPYHINVAQFLQGTYILRIAMDDGYSYVKFLKQ